MGWSVGTAASVAGLRAEVKAAAATAEVAKDGVCEGSGDAQRIKAELTLEHLVVSRVVEDAVELLRGGDELHVAA